MPTKLTTEFFGKLVTLMAKDISASSHGHRKVFIEQVWQEWSNRDGALHRNLGLRTRKEFDEMLVSAMRKGDVLLSRHDLTLSTCYGPMNLQAPSEVRYLNATFHLVDFTVPPTSLL